MANWSISLLKEWVHTSLYFGCFIKWQYSKRSPVLSSKIEWAQMHKNCSGYFHADACFVVGGANVSIRWYAHSCIMVQLHCFWHVFLAGVELWLEFFGTLGDWLGFLYSRKSSSISSGGNSSWLTQLSSLPCGGNSNWCTGWSSTGSIEASLTITECKHWAGCSLCTR